MLELAEIACGFYSLPCSNIWVQIFFTKRSRKMYILAMSVSFIGDSTGHYQKSFKIMLNIKLQLGFSHYCVPLLGTNLYTKRSRKMPHFSVAVKFTGKSAGVNRKSLKMVFIIILQLGFSHYCVPLSGHKSFDKRVQEKCYISVLRQRKSAGITGKV